MIVAMLKTNRIVEFRLKNLHHITFSKHSVAMTRGTVMRGSMHMLLEVILRERSWGSGANRCVLSMLRKRDLVNDSK